MQRGLGPEFAAGVARYDAASRRAAWPTPASPPLRGPADAGHSQELRAREGLRLVPGAPVLGERDACFARWLCWHRVHQEAFSACGRRRLRGPRPPGLGSAWHASGRAALHKKRNSCAWRWAARGAGQWTGMCRQAWVTFNERWAEMLRLCPGRSQPASPDLGACGCTRTTLAAWRSASRSTSQAGCPFTRSSTRLRHKDGH